MSYTLAQKLKTMRASLLILLFGAFLVVRSNAAPMTHVTGKYRLDSHEEATLALYLTQTEGNGTQETDPTQKSAAKRGWHKFTSVITVKYRGLLHLTFYDCTSGKPFGGVYFGTPKQIDSDHSVSVDHYPTNR
jgi:hypothetical protein